MRGIAPNDLLELLYLQLQQSIHFIPVRYARTTFYFLSICSLFVPSSSSVSNT